MLLADIRQLEQWQRDNLPKFHSDPVQATIRWVTKGGPSPKPLAQLYALEGFAAGSLRSAVTLLSFHGLLDISRDPKNSLRFVARPTTKLHNRMLRYAERLRLVIERYQPAEVLASYRTTTDSDGALAAD